MADFFIGEFAEFVFAKFSWNFRPSLRGCSALAGNRQYTTGLLILSRYDLLWWLVPEKIAFCLQRSWTKYRYFIWAKRSTAWHAVMSYSVPRIARLLASFKSRYLHQWLLYASIGMQVYCNATHANTCAMYWHVLWHVLWLVLVVCIEYMPACIQY